MSFSLATKRHSTPLHATPRPQRYETKRWHHFDYSMPSSEIPNVREEVIPILRWPTDTVAVDFTTKSDDSQSPQTECPHTILVFVPGNPGCIGSYIPNLVDLVGRLGRGFAARGVSYAGHSPNESLANVETILKTKDLDASIPWTVDGQIRHKSAYMDYVLSEYKRLKHFDGKNLLRFIFLSHSIGAHMVERVCIMRPDILRRTIGLVHLMPFTRMKAPSSVQFQLDWGASSPHILIGVGRGLMRVLRCLPKNLVDKLAKTAFQDDVGRELAVNILRQPWYAKNFLELGTEEIRDVPETVDTCSLRIIGKKCPIAMLYCGNDQWAPEFHLRDIQELQLNGVLPQNIALTFMQELRHDYVSHDHMVPKAVDWCFESIQAALRSTEPRSRL